LWSISKRSVSSYFQKIVNAFSGNRQTRRNPFLENHRFLFPVVGDGSGGSSSSGDDGGVNDPTREADKYTPSLLARNLDFSFVNSPNRIRFLKDADRAVRATRTDQMRDLLRRVEEGAIKSADPIAVSSHDRLLGILQQWNLVEAPGATLHSVAAWMHLLDITGAAALDGDEEDNEDEEVVQMTDKLLQTIKQNYTIDNAPSQSHADATDEIERALSCLVRQHRNQTGFGLHPDDRRGQYRDLLKQQRAIERQLGEMVDAYQEGGSPSPDMKRMVSTMYGYLHLKQQQAELLGYGSLVSHVFDKDGGGMAAASLGQVRALHGAVAQRLQPHLRQLAQRHEISSAATSGYLSPSGDSKPGLSGRPLQQSETGRPVRPMRWEKHVTLDGALQFATKIALDLFGLSIVEEQQASDFKDRVWDASVRLFHVHHSATSQYLGSYYLDALARPAKAPRSFATVLYAPAASSPSALDLSIALTPSTTPIVVGMSLNIEPPAWDTDPVRLRWDDILSLLHEFGHVLDIFLLLHSPKERMSLGTIAGHASLPFHRSEVLPKVRC
jgi:Peptidase family M3